MKNAMKKIMSLVLVAMILVSALPFAASADTAMCSFWIELELDGECIKSQTVSVPEGTVMDEATVKLYAQNHLYGEYFGEGYTYAGCYDVGGQAGVNGYIGAGIKFTTNSNTTTGGNDTTTGGNDTTTGGGNDTTPTAYPMSIDVDGVQKVLTDRVSITYEEVLQMTGLKAADIDYIVYEGPAVSGTQMLDAGDKIDLAGETRIFVFTEEDTTPPATTTPSTGNTTNNGTGSTDDGYHKLSGTVTLRIQLKGTNTYKDIAIKDGIAADGKVTLNEVKSVVKYYYNAIDTDTGIVYDGIYIDDSVYSLWMSYAHDEKYSEVLGLYDAAYNNNDVRLTVVISNAKLASNSSSNADSTNPKTGDNIMMPAMIMTVTASALAVAFFFNKKRAI